jgi:hypothetical protein
MKGNAFLNKGQRVLLEGVRKFQMCAYHQDRPVSGQRHQTEPVSQVFEKGSVRKVGYALVARQ